MATIDRIKISQEINFNGLPTWIGLEGILLEGEDEKTALRQLQKVITDYHQEEAKAYSQSRWGKKEAVENKPPDEVQDVLNGIADSANLDELRTWWLKSKGNLVISAAYKEREQVFLSQLQQIADAK